MTNQHSFVIKIKEQIVGVLLGGITLCGMMTPVIAQAQDMQSSPLSRFGYGTLVDRAPVAWRGMGNVGIGMNSNKVINLKNPAAYGATDSLSFILDLGASMNMGLYRDASNKKNTLLGGLDYVAMQFPVFRDRIAVSLGLMPFSRAGYGLSTMSNVENGSATSKVIQTYKGSGSLQSAYFGVGGRVYGGLFMGANVHYLFGSLTHSYTATPNDVYANATQTTYNIRLSNVSVDLGMQYRLQLKNATKDHLLLGLTYTPQFKATPKLTYIVNQSTTSGIVRPDITTTEATPTTALPHQYGAGLSWNRPGLYTVALDFSSALWSKVPNIFTNDGIKYRDTYNVNAGFEIKPDPYSRKYANRMAYRFGVNYGTSYLNLDKAGRVQTFGASVGFGMPVDLYATDRSSMINLSLEYLHTMPQQRKMFAEDMLKLSMSITFNETWFRTLKIY